MDLLSIVLVAVGLSMDCLAVAIAGSISMQTISLRQLLRISFAFGLFQFGMLVGGWYAGQTVVDIVEDYDHWIAFGLLLVVGGRMIWESFESEGKQHKARDITKGLALLTLAIATSIDSLGVGLSLAFVESRIWLAAIIVGCVAFLFTGAGFFAGRRIGAWLGRWADLVGGLVLIGIGVRIILEHLL